MEIIKNMAKKIEKGGAVGGNARYL